MKEENKLGYEKIGKLIRTFSIPCIISLVVNSLYNMVDQIFIGWGVGYLGNGATNVVFPLVITCLAFSLMIGDGTSAYLSLKLGQKKNKDASKGVINGIITSIIVSIIICIISLIFLPQLLNLFGCTDVLKDYAISYGRIIVCGIPFMIIGTSLNSIIRADGSPKYSMISMVFGAILNVILDPIFIFIFKMGVQGAAIATIISQFLTFILNILYIRKFKSIEISKELIKLDLNIIRKILKLGISSFITQMSLVIVFSVENNFLRKYGAISKYGSEIPLTVFGIVLKINQILNSIIIGISVGAQPIIGYNYGAEKYSRVKETIKIVLTSCVITSVIAFILFQTIPDKLISVFGSGDEKYIEFACLSFRIFLMLCICNGVQIPSGVIFQAIGKSTKSAILSLSRQIVLLVPAIIILGNRFGIIGILYAGPIADGIAFCLSSTMIFYEMRKMSSDNLQNDDIQTNETTEINTNPRFIVTISREYGSGGRYVGKLLAEKLGVKCYDKEFIVNTALNSGLSEKYIIENEEKQEKINDLTKGYYSGLDNSDTLFIKQEEMIKELAEKESCVIIGRCSNYILKNKKNVLNVFIYNDFEDKVNRCVKFYNLNKNDVSKEIKRINKLRENYYNHYTDKKWGNPEEYDLCINTGKIGIEKTVDMIYNLLCNV